MEKLIIIGLFIGAFAYIANKIRCDFFVQNSGCAKSCGACKIPNFEEIDTKKG